MTSLLFLLISLFAFFTPQSALAGNDITVICDPGPAPNAGFCETSPQSLPLFKEDDLKPGYNIYQELKVENHSLKEECNLFLSSSQHNDNVLKNVLLNNLKRSGTVIYTSYMSSLLSTTPVFIETIPANQTYIYDWQVSMDTGAGNNYQAQHLEFDLALNFECLDLEPTPTPNPYDNLLLNEIFPNPCDESQEWVEVYNAGETDLDLGGWGITDLYDTNLKFFTTGTSLAANSYTYQSFNSVLNNSGTEKVRLLSKFSILWDSHEYTGTTEGLSWSRQPDGTWCKTNPTLNAPNGPCLVNPSPIDCGGDNPTPGPNPSPTCDLTAPSAPQNLSASAQSTTSVSLTWTSPATGSLTHYAILYGTESGNYLYGNYNVGNVTSYLVQGLIPGQTYYFVVMAVNDCAPGPYSNEAIVTTGGTLPEIIPPGPAEGFESIRGVTTETGEVGGGDEKGVSTEKTCCSKLSPWWWILLLVELLYFYYLHQEEKEEKNTIIFKHIFLPLVLIILHILLVKMLDPRFDFLPTPRWTAFFPFFVFLFSLIFYPFQKQKQ